MHGILKYYVYVDACDHSIKIKHKWIKCRISDNWIYYKKRNSTSTIFLD